MVEKNQQKNPNNKEKSANQWLKDALKGINIKQQGKPNEYTELLVDKDRNAKRKLLGQVVLFGYKPTGKVKF